MTVRSERRLAAELTYVPEAEQREAPSARRSRSVPSSIDAGSDARSTAAGLIVVAPLVLAMAVGSGVATLLGSFIVLAAALLSPLTGLIALTFMAPFPRPLIVPTPGLYVALIGAILLGAILRLPLERPRLRVPSLPIVLAGVFLLYFVAQFAAGMVDGPPAGPRSNSITSSFMQVATGVITFVTAGLVLHKRSPYPVLATALISAVLAATTAFAQAVDAEALFGTLVGRSDLINRTAVDRATGPFLDPNYYGAYLVAMTMLAIGCAVIIRRLRYRLVLLATAAFVGMAMVLTLSRGALAATVAGLTAMAFVRGIRAGLLTVALLALVAAMAWPMFAEVRYAGRPALAGAGLSSQLESSDRTGAWIAGIDVAASAPLFGVGWGRLVEASESGIAAHNWFITILAETGIVGFLLWTLFIVAVVLALRRRSLEARTVGYSLLAAWMVASLFIEAPAVYGSSAPVLIVLAATLVSVWPASSPMRAAARARLGENRSAGRRRRTSPVTRG